MHGATVGGLVLALEHQYSMVVRATDPFGGTATARSHGVLVLPEGGVPLPGRVFDGPDIDNDVAYQQSDSALTVSWTAFGNGTGSAYQTVAFYEVAVGTSVSSEAGRTNIVPYSNVTVDMAAPSYSHTFEGLDLDAGTTTYFLTVRAHTIGGVSIFVSSSGVVAGWRERPTPGSVTLFPYQSSTSVLAVGWSGFTSRIPLTYRWAIATGPVPAALLDGLGGNCSAHPALSNVAPFAAAGDATAATSAGLSLMGGGAYFVTVQAHDEAGNCVQASSTTTTVDTTPPTEGRLLVAGHPAASHSSNPVIYVDDATSLQLVFDGFADSESGIESHIVTITSLPSCAAGDAGAEGVVVVPAFNVPAAVTNATLTLLSLLPEVPYFVSVTAVNRAGLYTTLVSVPILLDIGVTAAGHLNDGAVLNADTVFQSSTSAVGGIFTQVS